MRFALEGARAGTAQVQGHELASFAGCDYLGLAHEREVLDALRAGLARYGLSAGASRATTGNAAAHEELEQDLARFLGLEAALLVPDGYLSNLFVAQALAPDCPAALVDREAHVSIQDALAAAGVRSHAYAFCDAASARAQAARIGTPRCAAFTDGCFPVMRGIAPLAELLALLPQGGWLVVDDCHGTGVLGARGRGTHEHLGIADARLVVTGTLSKALGCFGGFVAGPRDLIEQVRARSHAFAGSTPVPPALAQAGSAGIRLLEREPARLAALRSNVERVRSLLARLGLDPHALPLPVFAWKARSPTAGRAIHERLLARGVLVPHVSYPDGLGSYFRLAVSAAHGAPAIARLEEALPEALGRP
jgi:8-amino-7-oxononanoate synthase